jgi:LVIVD repeat
MRIVRVMASVVMALAGIGLGSASLGAPSAGGLSSDNVEYIGTVPLDAGGATGARIVGKYLYVAGVKGFTIYDVSDPLAPAVVSTTVTGAQFPNEDVDTNGSILLVSNEQLGGTLQVWDVEDKAAPTKLAELSDARDHTFTCVLRCRWAYGARGSIVDLRDPSSPQVAGYWPGQIPGFGFDTTEVASGRVLTASRVIHYLDGRKDPARPKVVATGGTPDNRLIHSLRWPRGGRDRFFLVQGESPFSQTCDEGSGAFMTWDASQWRRTHSFTMIDEFRVDNGTFVDGNPPANAAGCTTMWFQEHPRFHNGGWVAAAFFEHGTRFLSVGRDGRVREGGYFTPFGGETIAAYWRNDEIVYAIDITRGIDILRFTR